MRVTRWKLPFGHGLLKLGCAVYGLGFGINTLLADQNSAPAQSSTPLQFTVIESKTVQEGDHTVTYNRVAPLPLSTVLPPAAASATTTASVQGSQTLQQLNAQQQSLVTVLVSAMVFNHQISQISWSVNGVTYQGYSNVDFTVFPADTQFSAGNTTYNLLINAANLGANPNAFAPLVVPSIPELPALTPTQSAYVVVATNAAAIPDQAVAPIDSLHDYFDGNRAAILEAATQRQADAAAQAQWGKDHPPVPQSKVINFWPIKSAVYGNAPQ